MSSDPGERATELVSSPRGTGIPATLTALLLGVIAYQLNASMVSPAVPGIAHALQSTADRVAISQTLFFLVGGITGVVLARYSDYQGRRRVLVLSLIVMCIGSFISMLAPTVTVLVIGRLLQGACGATYQITYLIMREVLTANQFGPALGLVTAISGGVGGGDQFLGGMLVDYWGFRSIFLVILIVGLLAIALSLIYVPESIADAHGKMDWFGASALSLGLIFINAGVTFGGSRGWVAGSTVVLLAASLGSFVTFWFIEKRSA